MAALGSLHRLLSLGLVLAALGGTMLAIVRLRAGEAGGRLRRWTGVVAVLVAADGVAGMLLALGGRRPADPLHLVVGPAALLALPLALVAGRRAGGRAQAWWLFLGWIVLLGLSLRAVGTGAAIQ